MKNNVKQVKKIWDRNWGYTYVIKKIKIAGELFTIEAFIGKGSDSAVLRIEANDNFVYNERFLTFEDAYEKLRSIVNDMEIA